MPIANSINFSTSTIATSGANANITSMTALSGALKAPTFIQDSNSNNVLGFNSVASATNYDTISNASTGNNPTITLISNATNADFHLSGKNNGSVDVLSNNTTLCAFLINGNTNTFNMNFTCTSITADRTITFEDFTGTGSSTPISIGDNITAHAGGGQGSAFQLVNSVNRISVCASSGDSVLLPINTGSLAMTVRIRNDGANSCNVYPQVGGGINSLGTNNPYALAAGAAVMLIASSATSWRTFSKV